MPVFPCWRGGRAAVAIVADRGDPGRAQRTLLQLDKRGWRRLSPLLARTHRQALQIAAESASRTVDDGHDAFATVLALLQFKRPSPGGRPR